MSVFNQSGQNVSVQVNAQDAEIKFLRDKLKELQAEHDNLKRENSELRVLLQERAIASESPLSQNSTRWRNP